MDGWVTIGTDLDTKKFDKQIQEVEYELEQIEYELSKSKELKLDSRTIDEYTTKVEKLNNKLIDLRKKQGKNETFNLSDIIEKLKNMDKDFKKMLKNVVKYGLAIFSIRSAYMGIRQAISTVSQYNDDMATKIESMRYTLAAGFEPILTKIVDLFYKLVQYAGYLIKAWTGVDIFANAEKGLKNANKQAKALGKQLAGFDEMNVLQDTSTSGGAGGGTIAIPELPEQEVPEWLKMIKDIGQWIIDNWETVVLTLLTTKLVFDLLTGNWVGVVIDLIAFVIASIPAIVDAVKEFGESAKKFWDEILWPIISNIIEWFGKIIGNIIDGISYVFTHMDEIIGAIGNAIGEFFAWIINGIGNLIQGAFNILGAIGSWIYEHIIKPIADFFVGLWNGIVDGVKGAFDWITNIFSNIVNFFKGIITTIINLFKTIGTKVADVLGGAFKGVINGVLGAIETILNTPIKAVNSLIKTINKVPGINLGTLNTFKLPRLAKGGIINQPGRGVMVGSAIAGERGQEGVIPLTDSQQMALLGEAIGKYITINASITNTMNGRIISRELQKIQNSSDFAFNR